MFLKFSITKVSIIAFAFLTLISSCEEKNDSEPSYQNIKISSITGIGKFTYYKNGLLKSIGSEEFTYDDRSRLISSRVYNVDTTFVTNSWSLANDTTITIELRKYSYLWKNGHVEAKVTDTLMHKELRNGNVSKNEIYTGFLNARYFYSTNRLDSIHYMSASLGGTQPSERIIYEYNEKGNMAKSTMYQSRGLPRVPSRSPPSSSSVVMAEYKEYDSYSNPFNALFEQYGVIFNKLRAYSISKNNPTETVMWFTLSENEIKIERSTSYVYNEDNLPYLIFAFEGTPSESIIKIEYE